MNKEETILAIDTSTATMAAAIVRGEQVLASIQTEAERNHSLHIMTNIEQLLTETGISLQELSAIVTGIGPGSYTGVRIAVTAAKTLAWTTGKPAIGVSSLECLAFTPVLGHVDTAALIVLPIVDARRGQVYTAAFSNGQNDWTRLSEDKILLMTDWVDEWLEQLQSHDYSHIEQLYIIGDIEIHEDAISRMRTELEQKSNIKLVATNELMSGAAIAAIGSMQIKRDQETQNQDNVHALVPNYAQLTEAEVKQNAKEKALAIEKEVGLT